MEIMSEPNTMCSLWMQYVCNSIIVRLCIHAHDYVQLPSSSASDQVFQWEEEDYYERQLGEAADNASICPAQAGS